MQRTACGAPGTHTRTLHSYTTHLLFTHTPTSFLVTRGPPCDPRRCLYMLPLFSPMMLRSWLRCAKPRISMLPKNIAFGAQAV
jgi:hypothetical protein